MKKLDFFKNKEISYLTLARSGYKQPQQAITINYQFSLGLELDLIINVDGFNESPLPFAELRPRNVFPFYSREWAHTFSISFFRCSPTSNILWKIGDDLAARI